MLILVGHVYPYIHPIPIHTYNPVPLEYYTPPAGNTPYSMGMDPIGKEVQVVPLGINL